MAMRVATLHVYPMKSMRGMEVAQADVEPHGLAGDRRWAVVDENGDKVTARRRPELLAIAAVPTSGGGVCLSAPGMPPLTVERPLPGARVAVGFSRLPEAEIANDAASEWLSARLGHRVRLVRLADADRRPVAPRHGGRPGDLLSLADAGPLLLTSLASLGQLNAWIGQADAERQQPAPPPLAMSRFRPNVVVDGELPFAEEGWRRVRLGAVAFHVAEICDRCAMTTWDPDTLERGPEPLRTLARYRRRDRKVWFGLRITPDGTGTIHRGDRVEVA
jgi:uncharacterized protein YcbX